MKIGFLIIGSEVLNGIVNDLNLKILSEFLASHQLEIHEALLCRDDSDSIASDLSRLVSNNDLVITSGGLGPTKDDITKQALASFFNVPVVFSEESLSVASKNYERLGKPSPDKKHEYAQFPKEFTPLNNKAGYAPGIFVSLKNKFVLSGPGVPKEFKAILEEHFEPLFKSQLKQDFFQETLFIRTKGIPEEKIFNELDTKLWDELENFGQVSSLPVLMGVNIGVKISASTLGELAGKKEKVLNVFESSPLKNYIWNTGFQKLEEKILEITNSKKIKFGFAESATGGLCSNRITNISGSSASFMGGIVCYDENVKENLLGVPREILDEYTAVSIECAEELARGIVNKLNLDIGISITGYAGPGGGTDKYPVGSVCIGVMKKGSKPTAKHYVLRGDREHLKEAFSEVALFTLFQELS